MKKVYFLAPLLALIAFGMLYASHRGGMREREERKATEQRAADAAKLQAEQDARRVAMADAVAAAEKRRLEKIAKEAREKAEREARQLAVDARDQAYRDQEKAARQLERLQKEIEAAEADLDTLLAAQKTAAAERAFLQDFVTRAQANARALETLLTQLARPAAATTAAK